MSDREGRTLRERTLTMYQRGVEEVQKMSLRWKTPSGGDYREMLTWGVKTRGNKEKRVNVKWRIYEMNKENKRAEGPTLQVSCSPSPKQEKQGTT